MQPLQAEVTLTDIGQPSGEYIDALSQILGFQGFGRRDNERRGYERLAFLKRQASDVKK